ncbi:Exosome complex component rrp42 [Exophiala xenobiotica]|nr:Exosome complex component rrp42 [Exophiala xenobiotica]
MPASASTSQLSPAELSYLHSSLSSHPPIRPDARLPTDFRPFSAETNVLPNTMGSAHVGFADGREAVVGVRAEVERTAQVAAGSDAREDDTEMGDTGDSKTERAQGKSSWISLTLTLPGLRDDDPGLFFLEEMLREVLVVPSSTTSTTTAAAAGSLQDGLVINSRWHWRLHIDVVLISPPEGSAAGSYPLPLLSMAIHLALRDTRIPRLKSEGEEDPLADDDWEASVHLYAKPGKSRCFAAGVPPITLLVMVVGGNVVFDPNGTELAVADGVFAVSIARAGSENDLGVPRNEGGNEWDVVPGVWRPKLGGVKRAVLTKVMKAVLGDVGKEIVGSLEAFVVQGG